MRKVVTVNARYAAYLQYGTRKMAPRPFADKALAFAEPGFIDECKKAVKALTE